jgi:hypothetical protein
MKHTQKLAAVLTILGFGFFAPVAAHAAYVEGHVSNCRAWFDQRTVALNIENNSCGGVTVSFDNILSDAAARRILSVCVAAQLSGRMTGIGGGACSGTWFKTSASGYTDYIDIR